jgi:hypothetical protein
MPDFTVDIGGLDALGKNLDRTVENIDGATKHLDDIGPDSIGPDDLDEACGDFRSDWQEGLDKIRDAVQQVRGGIDQTKQAYGELENAITQGLNQMAAHLGAPGGQ